MVELDRLQVRIVEGELNRPDTFQSQLTGMDGIFIPSDSKFLVQHPIYRIRKAHPSGLTVFSSTESVACGRSLIDMCKAAGVGHIVFTALDLVPNGEGSDHPGGQSMSLFGANTRHRQAISDIS